MLKHRSKQLLKRWIAPLTDFIGLYDGKIERLLSPTNRLLVLMYHRVIDDARADPFELGMCVQRSRFVEQLKWLSRHANVIPLQSAVEHLLAGEPLPAGAVAITFDDGYLDNLTIAAPLLKEYGFPATVYVVTGGLEEGTPLWWDQVIAIMAGTRAERLDTAALGLKGLSKTLSLAPSERRDSCASLLDALWQHDQAGIRQMIERLRDMLEPEPSELWAARRMNPRQVQTLAAQGFTIGAHTVSHIDPRHLDRDRLLHELLDSRHRLQNLCQQPVDSFAFPGGRSSVWMPDLLAQTGFHHAVTTVRGINQAPCDRYAIARVGMPDTPIGDFKRAIRNLQIIDASH
ncbi:MAG: polysaccharide deacetylase family protein [Lautropia sp.]|nr:polysaccharide deacetylase family protein [Lautropia sp.]